MARGALRRAVAARGRRVAGALGAEMVAQLTAHVDQRSDRLERQAADLRDRMSRLDEQVAQLARQVEALDARVETTARDLTRMVGEQVDGANDADEVLGRVVSQLRSEVAGLADAVGALGTRSERRRR